MQTLWSQLVKIYSNQLAEHRCWDQFADGYLLKSADELAQFYVLYYGTLSI